MRKKLTGGQLAALAAQQRGIVQTPQGYTSFPWNTHPNDRYFRVFPTGPFTQAWQGVQKINLITSVGTKRSSVYNPNTPVFLRERLTQVSHIQQNNQAANSWGGGPAAIKAQEDYLQQTGQVQSFTQLVLGRLRNGRS